MIRKTTDSITSEIWEWRENVPGVWYSEDKDTVEMRISKVSKRVGGASVKQRNPRNATLSPSDFWDSTDDYVKHTHLELTCQNQQTGLEKSGPTRILNKTISTSLKSICSIRQELPDWKHRPSWFDWCVCAGFVRFCFSSDRCIFPPWWLWKFSCVLYKY